MTQKKNISLDKNNLSQETSFIEYEHRIKKNNHTGGIFWLTGLSGSGKSTIAKYCEKQLFQLNKQVVVLDGDNIRKGLCNDLKFSIEDRSENIRRVSELALLFAKTGVIIITAFISPLKKDRKFAKEIGNDFFQLIHISTPIETCLKRDPKGLYKKAKTGEIKNFTGINSPYESPTSPNLSIDTTSQSIQESSTQLTNFILNKTTII